MGEQQTIQDAEGPLRAARPLHLKDKTLAYSAVIGFVVVLFLSMSCQRLCFWKDDKQFILLKRSCLLVLRAAALFLGDKGH